MIRVYYINESFMKYRIEFDSIGKIKVPGDKYWGASTERSNKYFNIGDFLVRPLVIHSIAIIKTNIEDYKQARKILQEALSKVKVRKFEKNSEEEKLVNHWVLSLNGNLAVTHLRESKPDSALYYLNEVENRNSDLIYPNQEYLLHEFRTQAYLQKQDLQLAENSMKKAAIICDTLFEKPVSPINAFYFGQIYLERKEFYKALNILKGSVVYNVRWFK